MVDLNEFRNFKYNPETGDIFNENGKIITSEDSRGYRRCGKMINKKWLYVKTHRLAWFLTYNEIPKIIDHKNGIKNDNRLENLRNCDNSTNQHNREAKGGSYHKRDKVWQASITINGRQKYIGIYDTEEEMYKAYLEAKKKYHKENRFTI